MRRFINLFLKIEATICSIIESIFYKSFLIVLRKSSWIVLTTKKNYLKKAVLMRRFRGFPILEFLTQFDLDDFEWSRFVSKCKDEKLTFHVNHVSENLEHRMSGKTSNQTTKIIRERTTKELEVFNQDPKSISLSKKHKKALEIISIRPNDFGLIFEDDAVFPIFSMFRLEKSLYHAPADWDVIMLAPCFSLKPSVCAGDEEFRSGFWKIKNHGSRSLCGYAVKKNAAKLIYENWNDFSMPPDFEMNFIMSSLNLNIYWLEPPLIIHGSENWRHQSEWVRGS